MDLEARLRGTRWGHIAQEGFTNAAHFPLANIFLEMLVEGPLKYFREPDPYVIIFAAVVQSLVSGSWRHAGRRLHVAGNLIGPAVYTAIEWPLEGSAFFDAPHHIAYWGFAFAIGFAQLGRTRLRSVWVSALIIVEHVLRTSILLAMYGIFERLTNPDDATVAMFLGDPSHIFVTIVLPLLGVLLGVANLNAERYLSLLRSTAAQLRGYSEWFLGRELLSEAVQRPDALGLQRRERGVLFADIRGFTSWSESHAPEQVVAMLNTYFAAPERELNAHKAIKIQMIGDEVMSVLPDAQAAAAAALALQAAIAPVLARSGVAAGIGVHAGPLVEGMMGGTDIKTYNVIGDTVNTAKRICDAAAPGEVLISPAVFAGNGHLAVGAPRKLAMKGKADPLEVFPLRPPP
jgi:class 3 adenylate cyclase